MESRLLKRLSYTVLSVALAGAFGLTVPPVFANEAATSINNIKPASACGTGPDETALLVSVHNVRYIEGNIRAQVYGEKPDDFLEKGKKLLRFDTPTAHDGQNVCVRLPAPGRYALVVMLDRNANGKADFFTEGFGFSRNPSLNFAPPDHSEVVFDALPGVTKMDVTLKYILGADEKKTEKRRKLRRR